MKIFVLEESVSQLGLVLAAFDEIAEPGDRLHAATSFERAVNVFRPPYDLMALDRRLDKRQYVELLENARRRTRA